MKLNCLKNFAPSKRSSLFTTSEPLGNFQRLVSNLNLFLSDYDKVEGVLYLLLEYAEMDLNVVIKNWNKTNHMLNALYFWNQMLLAVKVSIQSVQEYTLSCLYDSQVIHAEGVVHNDLKPANFVLIGAELKLIDFGISKRIEAEHTSFERDTRCGTSNYMSPETIQIYEGKDCFKVSCNMYVQ